MTLEVTRTRSVTIMDTFGGQASFFLSLQSDIASTYSYRILSKVTTLLQEGRSKGLRYLELIPEGYANLLSSIQPVQRPRVRILHCASRTFVEFIATGLSTQTQLGQWNTVSAWVSRETLAHLEASSPSGMRLGDIPFRVGR
jgi:hypothetical protein